MLVPMGEWVGMRDGSGRGNFPGAETLHCPLSAHSHPVLVVGTTCKPQNVPTDVQTAFLHEVKMEAPSEEQRRLMLSVLTASLPLGREVSLSRLARRTAVSGTWAGWQCWGSLALEKGAHSHSPDSSFSAESCCSDISL